MIGCCSVKSTPEKVSYEPDSAWAIVYGDVTVMGDYTGVN